MGVIMIKEKEDKEMNRQADLFREYFYRRNSIYEARLAKFLRTYPMNGLGNNIDLRKFEVAVMNGDSLQRKAILQAFQKEKEYWNSSYVVNTCNCNTHAHIIATLTAMEQVLGGFANYSSNKPVVNNQSVGGINSKKKTIGPTSPNRVVQDTNHWGRVGEEAVDYVLKWLPDMYCVIEKDCCGKYDDNVILLENDAFVDEAQEFDHLVIGPQGIFNIETKNYTGKLTIDQEGNWFRFKKGETEWTAEENPAQQLFRHHVLLQSIVGDNVPIIDVICMAHPGLMISGQKNSNIAVVKKDLLADFIVNQRPSVLSKEQIQLIKDRINAAKVSA